MIQLADGVYVTATDVSSIEDHDYWRGNGPSDSFLESSGCRILLKNGLKIYLKNIRAIDAHDMLFPPLKDVVPCPEAPRAILCLKAGDANE